MEYEGYTITERGGATSGIINIGRQKTSSIEVRDYGKTSTVYTVEKAFRFPINDLFKKKQAIDKAMAYIDKIAKSKSLMPENWEMAQTARSDHYNAVRFGKGDDDIIYIGSEELTRLVAAAPKTKEERDKLLVGLKEAKDIILTSGIYKEDSIGLLGINKLIKEME